MAAGADGAAGDGEGLEAFVAALRTLEPTGERGFEGFVRDVLRSVLGRQINLMKSGPQHGGDMIADSRPGLPEITIECKRHSKPLRYDDLRRKLEDALGKNPKLDLWVIAATTPINHEDLNRLRMIAKGAGVECLDWEANPGAIPSLAALCSLASLLHHATLCIAAYGFLVRERAAIPPSAPPRTGRREAPALPNRYRPRGAPAAP